MMSTHKLTAGDGYLYLIRQTAAADGNKGRSSLGDYYSAKGESPGHWTGRGLPALASPAGRELPTDAARELWTVESNEQVTEDQMKALFGLGLHPNASAIVEHLVTVNGLAKGPAIEAAKLGRPFVINDGDTPLQQRLAVAFRDHNLAAGRSWNAPIPEAERATMRTAIAAEMFAEQQGRPPNDARELGGFVARGTRQLTTSVAGYDLTFTPVKSVSALWAIAPIELAERVEAAHHAAVSDALEWLQDHAAFTRTGAGGVAQLDTYGFIAAMFTHRDTRAGDPGLHTHVAVSNKVRARGADGIPRWLALDGRPLFKGTVAASELYNTRLEGYLGQALGVRFADRDGDTPGKRPVREIVGIPPELTRLWSSRRAAIDHRHAELAKRFQTQHGREPTTVEAIALHQQATLETRQAKHEPRSFAEQRQVWRSQVVELLGGPQALDHLLADMMSGRRRTPELVTGDWIGAQAHRVLATVSESRSVWQYTHVYAEAQRVVRDTDHAADPGLARRITEAALAEPLSLAVGADRDADLGEPPELRRRSGASVFATHHTQQFTSADIVAAERRILAAARRRDGHRTEPGDVEVALATQAALRHELNAGQAELVRELATCGARVALALAPAGTGKTTAMATLARAWEDGGGHVVGLAPSAAAAQVLRDEIAVEATDTIAKYVWLQANPAPGTTDDPARVWFERIGRDTLVIVDEAGKAGTLDLDAVIGHAVARGASVRLIGDDQQLASISAGGVLRDLRREHGARTLVEVVRFADRSEAQASIGLRDGDPAALAYLIDTGRVHVGAAATAADLAYSAWRRDRAAGRDALLLAPTHELVALLNDRARHDRLAADARTDHSPTVGRIREVELADGLRASAGDIICTRRNARWRPISITDFVRNGYRWQVLEVTAEGAMRAQHVESGRRVTLPADYVAEAVTLGYATTIDSAQGVTADTCHVVGSDTLSRQMLYVAMTRGRFRNDIYLSTAETDPHRVLTPKATHPDTAVDVLSRALAHDDAPVSATTAEHRAADPFARLKAAAGGYLHALAAAAAAQLGPEEMARIDAGAEAALPGLTTAAAWPVLRGHLAMLAVSGADPLHRLAQAIGDRDLGDAADPSAVLDWRLDHGATRPGPLRWQPDIPRALADLPRWAVLQRRHHRVTELADAIRAAAAGWAARTAPRWARPLLGVNRGLLAEIAVFRAAAGVPDDDTRIAGPRQYAVRTRAVQELLERQAAAAIGRPDADTGRWNRALDDIDPHLRGDAYYPQLAAHLSTAARTGVDVHRLLADAAARGPLPDELPAAALWWRLAGTLSPATLDTPASGLRPPWTPEVAAVFGSALAETIVADPAWPGLVAAVAAADPRRWTPRDLLAVAAEHLRDADPDGLLRPDEYARLLAYSVDLFTTDHSFGPDVALPDAPPPTPEEDEELAHRHPDPQRPVRKTVWEATEFIPPDPEGVRYDDDLGPVDFDALARRRPAVGELRPALDDVAALRVELHRAEGHLARLAPRVAGFNGPALAAAMPRIRRLRERAAADRPHRDRIAEVFAVWADAEQDSANAQRQIRWARDEVERLRAAGADELDIASAEVHAGFLADHQPPPPGGRFYQALTDAITARAEAAGGAAHIVTDVDVDDVIAGANRADRQALRDAQTRVKRLTGRLRDAEAVVAAAFADAETRSAAHVLDRIDALRIELTVLEAGSDYRPEHRLTLPPTATGHLPDLTARAVTNLAAAPFTVTPVHAGDPETALHAMAVLHAAAAAQGRKVLWCTTEHGAEIARDADVADTVTDVATAHRRLADGSWTLPSGALLVVDHAAAVEPQTLAGLAVSAQSSQARLILLDPDHEGWPPGPSAPLMKLLHEDLPWSVTLSVKEATPARRSPRPDLDPVLDQADRLADGLRTDELRDALARRAQLRDQHRSSYRVHTELSRATGRDSGRGQDRGRER